LPNGKRVLIAGTKSADIFALDPDDNGKLLYRVHPLGQPLNGNGRGRSSIVWGGAADDRLVFYGIGGAGLAAVKPDTGERAWLFAPPAPADGRGRGASLGAAATAIPGAVFEGPAARTPYPPSPTHRSNPPRSPPAP